MNGYHKFDFRRWWQIRCAAQKSSCYIQAVCRFSSVSRKMYVLLRILRIEMDFYNGHH